MVGIAVDWCLNSGWHLILSAGCYCWSGPASQFMGVYVCPVEREVPESVAASPFPQALNSTQWRFPPWACFSSCSCRKDSGRLVGRRKGWEWSCLLLVDRNGWVSGCTRRRCWVRYWVWFNPFRVQRPTNRFNFASNYRVPVDYQALWTLLSRQHFSHFDQTYCSCWGWRRLVMGESFHNGRWWRTIVWVTFVVGRRWCRVPWGLSWFWWVWNGCSVWGSRWLSCSPIGSRKWGVRGLRSQEGIGWK